MKRHVLLCSLLLSATVGAVEPDGKAVFQRWCTHCHGTQPNAPGTLRLRWNRGDALALLEGRKDLDAAYVAGTVRHGRAEMPAFRPTEISAAELAAVVRLLAKQP